MGKLSTLPCRVKTIGSRLKPATVANTVRISGRPLQRRRMRLWANDPHCKGCGRVVSYPNGFELDHIVPLHKGGPDTDHNLQVLCCGPGSCHEAKTRDDLRP
jgi:5-methylcytosine-specific restriction enzyme A